MQEFFNANNALKWTVSVLIVGISINLISSYLKKHLDRALSKVSTKWATQTARRDSQRRARITALANSRHQSIVAGIFMSWLLTIINISLTLLFMTYLVLGPFDKNNDGIFSTSDWLLLILIVAALLLVGVSMFSFYSLGKELLGAYKARNLPTGDQHLHS